MKRPLMIAAVTWLQWLLGLSSAALVVYLLMLTRSKETLSAKDPAGEIQGLLIAAGVLVLPSLTYFFGGYGMHKEKRWGWWVALLTNLVATATFVFGIYDVDTHEIDKDVIPFAVGFLIITLWLLLPAVRNSYSRGQAVRL
jgi:glycerol uptake facilitator-like aquaporin